MARKLVGSPCTLSFSILLMFTFLLQQRAKYPQFFIPLLKLNLNDHFYVTYGRFKDL